MRINQNIVLIVGSILFIAGVIVLTYPVAFGDDRVFEESLYSPMLSITQTANKSDVFLLSQDADENNINYTVSVKNNQECSSNSLDILFAFDTSSSIQTDQINHYTNIIKEISRTQDPEHIYIGVIAYSDEARLIHPLTSNYDSVIASLRTIESGFRTNINSALTESFEEFASERNRRSGKDILFLITDDTENTGNESLDAAEGFIENDITIQPVALGTLGDTILLNSIATNDTIHIGSPVELPHTILSAISHQLGESPNTRVTASFPQNRFISYVESSHNGFFRGNRITWDLGDIACEEMVDLTYTLHVDDEAPDRTQVETEAFVSSFLTDVVKTTPASVQVHAPVFDVQITTKPLDNRSLNFVIDVVNTGSHDIENVEVVFPYNPELFEIFSASGPAGFLDGEVSWQIDSLGATTPFHEEVTAIFTKPQDSQLIVHENILKIEKSGEVVANAAFTFPTGEYDDLQISLAQTSEEDLYQLTVTNNGNVQSQNVIATLSPEQNTTVFAQDAIIDQATQNLTWFIPLLEPGEAVSYPFSASNDEETPILNAEVVSDRLERDNADNIFVYNESAISKPVITSILETEDIGEYSKTVLTITNNSSETANSVISRITIPPKLGLEPDSILVSDGTIETFVSEKSIISDVPTLLPGEMVTLTFNTFATALLDSSSAEIEALTKYKEGDVTLTIADTTTVNPTYTPIASGEVGILPLTGESTSRSLTLQRILLGLLFTLPLPILLLLQNRKDYGSLGE